MTITFESGISQIAHGKYQRLESETPSANLRIIDMLNNVLRGNLSSARPIYVDDSGVAWIEGTSTKVIEVVLDRIAYGLSNEQIHAEHPHWTLGQIEAAFAFYEEHKQEIDADIERRRRQVEEWRRNSPNSLTKEQLLNRLQQSQR